MLLILGGRSPPPNAPYGGLLSAGAIICLPVSTVVASFLADPLNFPKWATGLSTRLVSERDGDDVSTTACKWMAETPLGRATIRFIPENGFGMADHWVSFADRVEIYVPLRSVPNRNGAEVSLTLFRFPEMDDALFEADSDWVERDLATLKRVLECD